MADSVFTAHVTGKQLEAIAELFEEKGWDLNVDDNGSRYLAMREVADEYTNMKLLNDAVEPSCNTNQQSLPVRRPEPVEKNRVSIPVDRSQKSFKDMKQTGDKYQTLKSSTKTESVPVIKVNDNHDDYEQPRTRQGTWRLSTLDPEVKGHVKSEIHLQHFCVAEGNLLKVITSLSSEHIHQVSQVPVRIVLLVDTSGSMLNKLGRDGIHSKITKVKHFAKQLITSLDNGDEAAVVTFGKEAKIFFPLTKITADSRPYLMEMLNKLDQGGMSQETNLSSGLRTALKAFYDATTGQTEYLSRKNSILVFSDGEVNSGTIPSQHLVHEVRQNIRQMVPSIDDSQNQWVTISVITTGNSVSEQAYLLSKVCSSDAYYHIDKDTEDPEADLFIPVLLRKTAVAWNISVLVEVTQDIVFVDKQCTQDFRVRLRRSLSGKDKNSEKAYFLYDFPAGHSRQLGVCLDLSCIQNLENLSKEEELVKLRVEYSNIKGERLWQERSITVSDISRARATPGSQAALDAVHKHDLRTVSTDVFHAAAEHVRDGDYSKSKDVLLGGQRDIKAMLDRFGAEAQTVESRPGPEFQMYAKSVVENLGLLIDCMESSNNTGAWNKIKAVSTAISRETPNAAESVKDGGILCPLPDIEKMETPGLTNAMEKLKAKQGKPKRVTIGGLETSL